MLASRWYNEHNIHFISSRYYSSDRPKLDEFVKENKSKTKKLVNIGLLSDLYKLISFKLGMMIDTSKLHSFVPVSVALIFFPGHN